MGKRELVISVKQTAAAENKVARKVEAMSDKQLFAACRKAIATWEAGNHDDVHGVNVYDFNNFLLEELAERMGQ